MNRPQSGPNIPKSPPRSKPTVPSLPLSDEQQNATVRRQKQLSLENRSSLCIERDEMTEDSDADTLKVSDLRKRFEDGRGGGEAGGGVSKNGNTITMRRSPLPSPFGSMTSLKNGNYGNGDSQAEPSAAAAAAASLTLRPVPQPPSKGPLPPRPILPLLQLPPVPAKPPHPFGSKPGPSNVQQLQQQKKEELQQPPTERKKPPLAPKPRHLLADYKPAPVIPERQESLGVSASESLDSVRIRAKLISAQLHAQAERRMSIRIVTAEDEGSVPGTPVHPMQPQLPRMEEEREEDEEEEDGENRETNGAESDDADSEIDSEESRSTADTASNIGFGRRLSDRYASSTSGYGSSDLHSAIMKELASKGVTPGTGSSLPNSIGKMRTASTRQQIRSVSGSALHPSPKSDISSTSSFLGDSASGSGVVAAVSVASSGGPSALQEAAEIHVPDYSTGDEKEDSRLKKLHYAALEFLTVQRMFVEYLNMIINVYPSYLAEYGEHTGRLILATSTSSTNMHIEGLHVVQRVQKLLIPYHEFHKVLLKDIAEMMEEWSSLNPRMSTIFERTAPFLKQCVPFLKEKSKIADEMTRLIKEDGDFAAATLSFEQRVFKRGVGAVIQQLDQIHQNFMRYKLLMQSYLKFLPEGSEEWMRTEKVIHRLESINMEVNQSMGLPTSDQLMRLATLFQGQFDVFKQGRRLIRQENVDKQTRKDTQPRSLILFSDTLWLVRTMSSLGSTGMFDIARSYSIPIEDVRIEIIDHFDYDCYMNILSKKKSAGLWFKCASARDEWRKLIETAKMERLALIERKQTAKRRTSRLGTSTPLDGSVGFFNDDVDQSVLARTGSGLSRNSSCSSPAAAAAAVSFRPAPPPPLKRPHSIIVAEGGISSRQIIEEPEGEEETAEYARSDDDDEVTTPIAGLDDEENTIKTVQETASNGHNRHAAKQSTSSGAKSIEIGEQPVWINDQMSTKCLMDGCDNDFNLFHRRHHCRNCGWLICKKCRGYAPVQRLRFEREIVCPECYDDIEAAYFAGTLFPPSLLVEVERGVYWLSVTKGKKGKSRSERVNPSALFSPPSNRRLKRMQNIDQRMRQGDTVYGKVFLKKKSGGESELHAHLDGLVLAFYKAAFDKQPAEHHVIYGYGLTEEDVVSESGRILNGKRFILRHTNQHGSELQQVISFRVLSDTSAKMWSAALKKALKGENLEDEDDN